jgi:Zn-finger domain-containing protein
MVKSRLRSLGCSPCTGAIRSDADTIPDIIAELISFRSSERANRVIDHDQEGSMELKKREGYTSRWRPSPFRFSIDEFLAQEREKDLLRFSTAGSVDDGKSTLIGRLLYDTQSVYEDQVRSIEGKGTTRPGRLILLC